MHGSKIVMRALFSILLFFQVDFEGVMLVNQWYFDERTTSYGQTVKFLGLHNTSGQCILILSLKQLLETCTDILFLCMFISELIFLLMSDD